MIQIKLKVFFKAVILIISGEMFICFYISATTQFGAKSTLTPKNQQLLLE